MMRSFLPSAIVLLPLMGALMMGWVYLFVPNGRSLRRVYLVIGLGAPLLSALLALIVVADVAALPEGGRVLSHLYTWVAVGSFEIDLTFLVDRLSAIMLLVVTLVGTLIHIYAVGYMREDEGFGKFFAYFNFFLGAMLILILANNPILLFIGWELVGLASWLLIGYYHHDPANMTAANKAFILNRVGDFGFISGLGLLFVLNKQSGFDFDAIFMGLGSMDTSLLTVAGLLLFVGAMGKSAQIPLYVWLPDAMAGPTPVSALIHAATMVTAGVYMVARFAPMYNLIPDVGVFIASIGAASALLAALFASYQNDIKKILAYSTMSQLGYMFIAVGLGAYSSGIFHLFAHAFFKALLFMGAGAVIIALHHEQDIFRMGGLRNKLPTVYRTMLVATLAISGIPIFVGFFSKDAILSHAYASGHTVIWAIGVVSAFLTAYYMFRLFFVVFVAPAHPGDAASSLHPLSRTMTVPLVMLAFGSAVLGFWNLPEAYGGGMAFAHWIHLPDQGEHLHAGREYLLDGFNVLVALLGIGLAYRKFVRPAAPMAPPLYRRMWQKALAHTLWIDQAYHWFFVRGLRGLSDLTHQWIDPRILDGTIRKSDFLYREIAGAFARLHNGNLRWYALSILFGISGISLYLLILAGGV